MKNYTYNQLLGMMYCSWQNDDSIEDESRKIPKWIKIAPEWGIKQCICDK